MTWVDWLILAFLAGGVVGRIAEEIIKRQARKQAERETLARAFKALGGEDSSAPSSRGRANSK